jgi:thiosulfate/3-mercaptopyruvate sulfurtransferase
MSAMVSAEELSGLLREVTVLDVRWRLGHTDGHRQFLAGHVPGAAYVDLETDLADPPGRRGRHPLPDPDRFAAAMSRCGVRGDRPVVVYDDWAGLAATRAWWLLRYHGHPDVRVLDGGWASWRAGGHGTGATRRSTEMGERLPAPGDFRADPGHLPVVDARGAARVARAGLLLDARAPERFRGEVEPVDPVPGHIPGAVNVPATGNLDGDRFRPVEQLATAYAATEDVGELAVYCGSGVSATHDVFVLYELGREAALYPGSWSEWVADPARPVAVGPAGSEAVQED